MALINKITNEYLRINNISVIQNTICIEIYKNKEIRFNLSKYDKINTENVVINNMGAYECSFDATLFDNLWSSGYELLKSIPEYSNEFWNDDI